MSLLGIHDGCETDCIPNLAACLLPVHIGLSLLLFGGRLCYQMVPKQAVC